MDIASTLDALFATPSATAPSYAADGRLYFLNDAAGSAQVWELPADGSPARPRSMGRDAVAFVAGHPASGGAVFGRDTAGDERLQFYWLDGADGAEADPRPLTAEPSTMFGWGAFSADGRKIGCTANNRDPAHADPIIIDLATGSQQRAAELAGPHAVQGWRPDGTALTLAAVPRTFKADLFDVDIVTGARQAIASHETDARHQNARWRNDGTGLYLLTDRNRDHLAVAMIAPGGEPRLLYAPDWDVEKLEVSPDQSLLAVVVNEAGFSQLRLLDAATGALVEAPEHPAGSIAKLTWRPDSRAIAFDLTAPDRPSAIWLAECRGAVRMLFAAGAPPEGARPYHAVTFPAFDGRAIPAFLARPAGPAPASGWPVIVWVHGGPEAQALPNWRPDLQLMLRLGAAVLIPNIRGSTGYGRAYAALDDRELRPNAIADVASAQAWLASQTEFDAKRIAIWGQSYGGWMVLAAVTRFPERWAAGVDFYGIARWKTMLERTGPWRVAHRAAEYGDPVHDAALLESLSPLHDADRIQCPMLVAQGLTDPRVPPAESEQIVAALGRRNVPVEYLTFADEGHGFLKRDNRRTAYLAVAAFLSRHLALALASLDSA